MMYSFLHRNVAINKNIKKVVTVGLFNNKYIHLIYLLYITVCIFNKHIFVPFFKKLILYFLYIYIEINNDELAIILSTLLLKLYQCIHCIVILNVIINITYNLLHAIMTEFF